MMRAMHFFDNAAVILAAAALLVYVLHRLRQSSIVAFLLLGMVVGPSALDLVASGELIEALAEIGVVLLLFFIGLEFNVDALRRMAGLALLGSGAQLLLTTAAAAVAARALGWGWAPAAFAGLCVALSSTAIVMKAFEDRREADSHTARASLAILLGQDLVAMAALAATALLAPDGSGAPAAAAGAAGASWSPPAWLPWVGLPLLFAGARAVLPRLFARAALTRNAELFALSSLAACFLVASVAHLSGASVALGAFLGGLVFADTAFEHQMRADLGTVKNLALGLFFLSIGMLVDLRVAGASLPLLAGGVVAVVIVKTAIAALVLRMSGKPWRIAAGGGLALSQVGEFAFVLATSAGGAALLGDAARERIIPLAVLSMLAAPSLVAASSRFGRQVAAWLGRGGRRGAPAEEPADAPGGPSGPYAIVVGYGPVGRTLCRILLKLGVRVCVIEINPGTVEKLRKIGREALFGDASRREVLQAARIEQAQWLIVTLPDLGSRAGIVATARAAAPRVRILSRARYLGEQARLESAGADAVAYEEAEVAVELAQLLLSQLGVEQELVDDEIRVIRSEIAVRTGFTVFRPGKGPTAGA